MRASSGVQLGGPVEQRPWNRCPWGWGQPPAWSALHWYLLSFSTPDLVGYAPRSCLCSTSLFLEMASPSSCLLLWLHSRSRRVFLLLGWEKDPSYCFLCMAEECCGMQWVGNAQIFFKPPNSLLLVTSRLHYSNCLCNFEAPSVQTSN